MDLLSVNRLARVGGAGRTCATTAPARRRSGDPLVGEMTLAYGGMSLEAVSYCAVCPASTGSATPLT